MTTMSEIKFWGQESDEILSHTTKDEAIEAILDDTQEMDGVLEICGFQEREMNTAGEAEHVCESILERWDEEYGGEDQTEMSDEMLRITKEYIEKMKSLYEVWQCEIKVREKVDIKTWIAGNRPDWLGQKENHIVDVNKKGLEE